MTTPDTPALAALREAERTALEALEEEIGALSSNGFVAANVSSAWHGVRAALTAYRDAVAARVREELLASGTPLWVATSEHTMGSAIHDCEPMRQVIAGARQFAPQLASRFMFTDEPLTPPGTCRRAVLTILPEEGEG